MFCLHAYGSPRPRLVLAEAAIDALSIAAIENLREDTLYSATGGGMGPGTIAALEALLGRIAMLPGALFCSATDANGQGPSPSGIMRSPNNSQSRLSGFGLRSTAATGTTCSARAEARGSAHSAALALAAANTNPVPAEPEQVFSCPRRTPRFRRGSSFSWRDCTHPPDAVVLAGSSFLFAPMSHSLRLRCEEVGTATANVGRADKGVSQAPARTARPCSATASRLAGRAGARKAKGMPAQLLRSNARSGHDRTRSRNQRTARQSALRCRTGANAATLETGSEGEHEAQPEVPTRQRRDLDR